MKKFRDTETGNIITEEELKAEFEELKSGSPEEYNYTFSEYIRNCTAKNGFLEEIKIFVFAIIALKQSQPTKANKDTKSIISTILLFAIGAKWKRNAK